MKAANPSQIPAHTNCRNCGKCCGVIPVTDDELTSIRSYQKRRKTPRFSHGDIRRKTHTPFTK